jgi:hypothetical protein
MTPETDPGQIPDGARPLGSGAHLLPLRPRDPEAVDRAMSHHPAMRAVPRIPTARPPADEDIERFARVVDMTDLEAKSRPRPPKRQPGKLGQAARTLAERIGVRR